MPMARKRRSHRGGKIQPAQLDLFFQTNPGDGAGENDDYRHYVDTAHQLSKVNRRMYSQERMYAYQGLTFIWKQNASQMSTLECTVRTAGNTWIVQNAWVKGKALWDQMQDLVLDDNPSVKGKWHDFKIALWEGQSTARTLEALAPDADGAGYSEYKGGEWNLATFVMPQHDVDPDSGLPKDADEFTALLIGDDTTTKRSLVKAYEESRSTVQSPMPNAPAGLADSFFSLLTDTGSQEPELADVIVDENDTPPYDLDEYPGSDTNAVAPVAVGYSAISSAEVDGRIGGFIAPCGLIEIELRGYQIDGTPILAKDMPSIDLLLHVAPGMYKGTASVPMGQ